ncbi:MAG: hypothetical protein E7578_03060 [Ruminococcaceae bacterium]|nr:hypothetical protein [Oscillospiraceae bacterium]
MKNRIISLILAGIIAVGTAGAVSAEDVPERAKGVAFNAESGYVASTYTGTLNGAAWGTTTAGDLIAALENSVGVEVRRGDAALAAAEILKYGDKVVLTAEDGTVKSSFDVKFMGDANSDSKVNLSDASKMLQKIAKWEVTIDEMSADVDGNAAVNLSDVSKLLQVLAKWDVDFVKNPVIPGKVDVTFKQEVKFNSATAKDSLTNTGIWDGFAHYDLGVKFVVGEGDYATKISAHCPSYAENTGSLTFSVYKWAGDYESTIASMPIVSNRFVDYKDNATLIMDLSDTAGNGLAEGEYLWRVHEGSDPDGNGVGIYFYSEKAPAAGTGFETFLNKKSFNIGPDAGVYIYSAK